MTITATGALSPDTGTVPVFPFSMFDQAPRLRLPHSRPRPHAGRRNRILAAVWWGPLCSFRGHPGPGGHRQIGRGWHCILVR